MTSIKVLHRIDDLEIIDLAGVDVAIVLHRIDDLENVSIWNCV